MTTDKLLSALVELKSDVEAAVSFLFESLFILKSCILSAEIKKMGEIINAATASTNSALSPAEHPRLCAEM